jgi:hypothetical protein
MGLAGFLRNFAMAGPDVMCKETPPPAGRAIEPLISPGETERFARHGLSHWNP